MLLAELLCGLAVTEAAGIEGVEVGDLAYDSRRVRPGTLFVAVPTVGAAPDSGGHRHLAAAAGAGAVAAVIQAGPPPEGLPWVRVPDGRAALADLSAAFFRYPSRDLRLFAVTGTDGKTTTTYLLDGLLSAAGRSTGLIGTVETRIGNRRLGNEDRMTTPESLDLQRLLRRMRDEGITDVAMEASSHALALDRLRALDVTAAAATNITADHIEFHGSPEAYVAAKARLFTSVAADRPAVLNAEDERITGLAELVTGPVLWYGRSDRADLRAHAERTDATGTAFELVYRNERVNTRVPMPGAYNVLNALAAAGLALHAGLTLVEIGAALPSAPSPPGRMQRIECGQPFEVIVDYAHTVHAVRSVLASVRARTAGRVIAVLGAAGNRDRAKRPVLARIARELTDFFYVTNEDPFDEDPAAIIAEIASGLDSSEAGRRFQCEEDRCRAIALALARATAGDAVVILGKGHERSIVVAGRKEPWSDAETVRRLLGGPS